MKKFCFIIILISFLFTACNESEENKEYASFLSDEEGKYALYVVSDDAITFEELQENDINNVKTFTQEKTMEDARLEEIEEAPTFIVFDTKDKVYKTNNRDDLFKFLQEH
ncbi:MAG: hypothetical protein ACQEWU_12210 [Bacillota bacterium]|uniref:Uncharacterized protein n=1 Tax=Virgibacillus salarius TaxID=447199 RepID=A0A941ICQ1_9BACI|nr:hypothetical protein [Virgibacillus salarius]MBR7796380.1 hypothetical protein [Virgibacillus salarius]NAZ09089.1 hypothetical protein [Agaribacter marinus]WBX80574.1 hypothetical protein PD280_01530 [Virgibacillus salarius]